LDGLRPARRQRVLDPRVQAMSAEAPTPHPEMPRRRSRVVKSNRNQILLFSILTPGPDRGRGVGRPDLAAQFRDADVSRRRGQRSRSALRRLAGGGAEE